MHGDHTCGFWFWLWPFSFSAVPTVRTWLDRVEVHRWYCDRVLSVGLRVCSAMTP